MPDISVFTEKSYKALRVYAPRSVSSGRVPFIGRLLLILVMTVCFPCMVGASHDVELLPPSITESAAVGLPFPAHSSPLGEQSAALEISLASAKGNAQRRWQT